MDEFVFDTIEFLSSTRNKIKKATAEGRLIKEEADAAWALYHLLEEATMTWRRRQNRLR